MSEKSSSIKKRRSEQELLEEKCPLCGRLNRVHKFRVTTFEYSTGNQINIKEHFVDDYEESENFFWFEDSGVKMGKGLGNIDKVVISEAGE